MIRFGSGVGYALPLIVTSVCSTVSASFHTVEMVVPGVSLTLNKLELAFDVQSYSPTCGAASGNEGGSNWPTVGRGGEEGSC